ncbi:N-formylglutamate amidohydrolase [Abyssibacter sp.]|jgi:predicted N-formylglutamate amidohydrolase|uniref:N-formylglutamate amidohydrolase n=1 Tax=Abyssibacter sp. TaxID=2320200 RepID=UPI0025B7C8D6|nr:N-formylglutamate amidohydrolase [Abyssibacter sp.]MCK5859785.1 N-formylglutamate amidohydrolase [Abyssibacter sp.]
MTAIDVRLPTLLADTDAPPTTVIRPEGRSDFLLVCDHASRQIPPSLNELGLTEVEQRSHIAWDIGAGAVVRQLADRLDATAVTQNYSRLVIDCNRPLDAPDSIRTRSERGPIAANTGLNQQEREARQREIFLPYHEAIRSILDERAQAGRTMQLVAIHSFTPVMDRVARPWHVGLMARHHTALAETFARLLRRDRRLHVGMNEPYAIDDDMDYTLPIHGEQRGIAHVGIEIRQDLIGDADGQATWAGRLANLFGHALNAAEHR